MKKRVIFLSGTEPRHTYVHSVIASCDDIEIVYAILEGSEQSLKNRTDLTHDDTGIMREHILQRQKSEESFFKTIPNIYHPIKYIAKGSINSDEVYNQIKLLDIDYVVCYGSSILKDFWFDLFPNKIINMHLGLSPYYRGSGTNFWAMADNNFACIGTTFMYMDKGIDTGKIIIQKRATVQKNDTPHCIGNRLIKDSADFLPYMITHLKEIENSTETPNFNSFRKFCARKDFTQNVIENFYKNFSYNRDYYIENMDNLNKMFPIVNRGQK